VKAHLQYLRYLMRHKWFVFVACWRLGVPLHQAIIHDWSKFLPGEWFPYVRFFYGLPRVGDKVEIDSYEGFGGTAVVLEVRDTPGARYRVEMLNGSQPRPFWAHDFEVSGLCGAKEAFDLAWRHHQRRQPHHWQYWLLTLDSGETFALKMPDRFVKEMVADWMGAGRALGFPDTAGWYARNKDRMLLECSTRDRVEQLLGQCCMASTKEPR